MTGRPTPADAPTEGGSAPGYVAVELPGVGAIAESDWTRLFPDDAEGWAYYRAVEGEPPEGLRFEAMVVERDGHVVAAAPVFHAIYRLDTPLQGRLRPLGDWLYRVFPGVVAHPVIGFGSTMAERCHLGVDPALSPTERRDAVVALCAGLEAKARREGVRILAMKDVAETEPADIHATIAGAGFSRIAGLPVAVLDLPFADVEGYIRSLSANMRSALRRKLKTAGAVQIEIVSSIDGIEDEIYRLYEATRANSSVDYGDFEQLSPSYFRHVVTALGPDRCAIILARVDGRLLAMQLCFLERERVIFKFWGMRYPEGREHNLYFIAWVEGVRLALSRGAKTYQSGQTAYTQKAKLGSRLVPVWIYFRHRWPLVNRIFRLAAPHLAFDKMDPELAEIRKRAGDGKPTGT
jgi:hypothetical protein